MNVGKVVCLLILALFAPAPQEIQQEDLSSATGAAPALSDRIANYRIEVRLDSKAKTIRGYEILTWKNPSEHSVDEFCFHLYLNAFRNNRSTFIQEEQFAPLWANGKDIPPSHWGHIDIESIRVLGAGMLPGAAITSTEYIHPDDDNYLDGTVLRVRVNSALPPGQTIQFRIQFASKLPRGTSRTGWARDYFFAAQWFPKIGVFQNGVWNCHQYHRFTEYFADYGVYDVALTVPSDHIVGATGRRIHRQDNQDGTTTHRYQQADVHDFAWTASPRFLERRRRFTHRGLPSVELILLLQPEHRDLEERYFQALENAVRYLGEWFGPYPYPTLTLVDPAHESNNGGMEYPTFITGGAHFLSPKTVLSPEGVTIHEFGHQYWYGLVANNEFEEAWLDEGINSWAEARVQKKTYPPSRYMERFFGGIPVVFWSIKIPFETAALPRYRSGATLDAMARPGWHYYNRLSYLVNSYSKPEVIFWTLERLLGEKLMLEVMRTYQQRYRFKHPTTSDFIATVHEVAGRDMSWFFDQTFFSSEIFDYEIQSATSKAIPAREGFFEVDGRPAYVGSGKGKTTRLYLTEVVVRRKGGVRFPVDVLMVFENGERVRRRWDGQYRWHRFEFQKPVKLKYAVVDPDRRFLLDIDPTNNSRLVEQDGFSLTTKKWSVKWLFWLQNLLETFTFIG